MTEQINHTIDLQQFLKVKQTSLDAEIKIIKKNCNKFKFASNWLDDKQLSEKFGNRKDHAVRYTQYNRAYCDLRSHYWNVVYVEARATSLARAYFKKMPYAKVEPGCKEPIWGPVYNRAVDIISKYESRATYWSKNERRSKEVVGKLFGKWLAGETE